jgi:hypothetical protein
MESIPIGIKSRVRRRQPQKTRGTMLKQALTMVLMASGCAAGDPQVIYRDPPATTAPALAAGAPAPKGPSCTKVCGDRVCGPDQVCGASCGICAAGSHCTDGLCVSSVEAAPVHVAEPAPPIIAVSRPPPRENGQTCTADGDCAANHCAPQIGSGERRCYGNRAANQSCDDSFDCDGGACFSRHLSSASPERVCAAGASVCYELNVPTECGVYAAFACAFVIDSCGAGGDHPDFSECVAGLCRQLSTKMPSGGCAQAANALQQGRGTCP